MGRRRKIEKMENYSRYKNTKGNLRIVDRMEDYKEKTEGK